MTNFGSLLQFPEELRSTANPAEHWKTDEEDGAQLLELRSESGPIYLRLSRWQRIRFQWTFRHFHVLPPQVLSRWDQHLIEKLFRTAVVTPALPVPASAIVGVVEKARAKPRVAANRVVTLRAKPDHSDFLPNQPASAPPANRGQWGAWSRLAAVCVVVVLVSVYGNAPAGTGRTTSAPMPSAQVANMANEHAAAGHAANSQAANSQVAKSQVAKSQVVNSVKPADSQPVAAPPKAAPLTTASLRSAEEVRGPIATPPPAIAVAHREPAAPAVSSPAPVRAPVSVKLTAPAPVEPTPATTAPAAQPLFVAELPQGHFAHPVVSQRNLEGELQLKALIGADGSVKQVTVLSGDPRLAQVAMRAVRQWHYSPYQVLGSPVEVQTQIKMSFFGQDAVSIASVAHGPAQSVR